MDNTNNQARRTVKQMPPLVTNEYHNSDTNLCTTSEGDHEENGSYTAELYDDDEEEVTTSITSIPHSAESTSNTSYHSSEEDQHNTIADQVGLGIEYERDRDARPGTTSIVPKLLLQQKLYDTGPLEDYCSDTEKCLQRYFKTIYRQIKFFSDSKEDIKCPNFVVSENSNSSDMKQTVQICTWLLTNTGKGHYNFKQKIMFWKTYWRMIYKEISKLRMGDTNKFKRRFIKGTY